MSVLDQIRKLDEQKAQLLQSAKQESLDAANKAIASLRELGFNYRLAELDGPAARTPSAPGTRRTGQRDSVLATVKAVAGGISAADVLATMKASSDAEKTSVRNALSALKRNGALELKDGKYVAK